jgi:hypothetical protein
MVSRRSTESVHIPRLVNILSEINIVIPPVHTCIDIVFGE